MNDYKPGTFAVATVRGVPNTRIIRTDTNAFRWASGQTIDTMRAHQSSDVTDVRPLIVLDLPDPQRLLTGLRNIAGITPVDGGFLQPIIDQIEAQTRPPKPAEPTELGSVVVDADGRKWVRANVGSEPWFSYNCFDWRAWHCIDVAEVVR